MVCFIAPAGHNARMIRTAVESDLPALRALIQELAAYEHLSHMCRATDELLRRHLFGAERAAEALVAEADGAVVGYAVFFKTFSTFLARPGIFLEDLYVQPAHRRRGLGKALLRHIAGLAVARGYGRVEWSVLDWNAPSIGFYTSLGAVPLEDWTMMRLSDGALTAFAS